MLRQGAIYSMIEELFKQKHITGDFSEAKKNLLKIQVSIKSGLSLNKYTHNSLDSEEDINKIKSVLESSDFNVKNLDKVLKLQNQPL